jgi:hypothetical protein
MSLDLCAYASWEFGKLQLVDAPLRRPLFTALSQSRTIKPWPRTIGVIEMHFYAQMVKLRSCTSTGLSASMQS